MKCNVIPSVLLDVFATPWTVACQVPLSMRFSRQEHWMGCHALLQGIFLTQAQNENTYGEKECIELLLLFLISLFSSKMPLLSFSDIKIHSFQSYFLPKPEMVLSIKGSPFHIEFSKNSISHQELKLNTLLFSLRFYNFIFQENIYHFKISCTCITMSFTYSPTLFLQLFLYLPKHVINS